MDYIPGLIQDNIATYISMYSNGTCMDCNIFICILRGTKSEMIAREKGHLNGIFTPFQTGWLI